MLQKTNCLFLKSGSVVFILLVMAQQHLFGWSEAIKIAGQEGIEHRKPVVCYSPAGKLFIVYDAGAQIHLGSYDGTGVTYEKRISESTLLAYEACMFINKRGIIHITWIECSSFGSNTQYVKYRFYNGSSWSAVSVLKTLDIPGALPGGFVTRKVEDLRMTADENDNVFLAYMVWPAGRCQFISKYGSQIQLEDWPMTGRSKHPDVAVDSNYVHIAWQQLWSSNYTIAYCRRTNSPSGRFQTVIDVRDGSHRPRIAVDPNRVPHIFQMDDYETARMTIYKYWTGNGFSQKFIVSDDGPKLYNNIGISIFDSSNIFTMELTTTEIFYNWKQNGEWSGHKLVDNVRSRPDGTWTTLSPDGKTAVIAYTDRGNSVYINLSTEGTTPPPPGNIPPVAFFNYSPNRGHYPLSVTFNAGDSQDSDGQIISYSWDFGDGTIGQDVVAEHSYLSQGFYTIKLTVTDNDGASASTSYPVEVSPPNIPPSAFFNYSPNNGHFPLDVTCNAGDSRDSDGQIVSYSWDFGDGTFGQGMIVNHRYSINGFRQITLTVTDDDGAWANKSSVVEVFQPNVPPVILFTIIPASGLYPLSAIFDATNSIDSDGQIVSYFWDFGDGTFGQGEKVEHLYSRKNIYPISLTIIDNDGASATATGEIEVFGLYPPLNMQYARHENRNLFSVEYLYRITWSPNPGNEDVGATIMAYKIYRREKGSSYNYDLFYTFPAGNQTDYEYLDRTLGSAPLEYDYKITSMDSAGRESD